MYLYINYELNIDGYYEICYTFKLQFKIHLHLILDIN